MLRDELLLAIAEHHSGDGVEGEKLADAAIAVFKERERERHILRDLLQVGESMLI